MPGEISQSYDGPADPCPRCRAGGKVVIDAWCHWCHGKTWLPDDMEVVVTDDDDDEGEDDTGLYEEPYRQDGK